VLFSRKSFFFRGKKDLAIPNQRHSGVVPNESKAKLLAVVVAVMDSGKPENIHALSTDFNASPKC
jgi:hypothetical protein